MEKQNITWNVRQAKSMYEKGTINFNVLVQRRGNQWTHKDKSKLIQTLLENLYMPAILSKKYKVDDANHYDIIDGQQRLTNIFDFVDNKYPLHKDIPEVEYLGDIYEVAGKTYDELDEALQDQIKTFSIVMYAFENATDDEIRELFKRLNSGKPLTADQKMRANIDTHILKQIDILLEHRLFEENAAFTNAQIRNQTDQTAVIQSIMLLSEYDFKEFSKSSVEEFAQTSITDEDFARIEGIFDYLVGAYDGLGQQKFMLRNSNFPITVMQANMSMINNITAEQFREWSESFVVEYDPEESPYAEYVGQGSTKKVNVMGKVREMNKHFNSHFELDHEKVKIEELTV